MNKRLINRELKIIWTYVIMILLLFSSKDTWLSYHNGTVMYISQILLFGILLLMNVYERKIDMNTLKIVLMLFILVLASMLFNFDLSGYSMFVILSIALFIEEKYEFKEFFHRFEQIIILFTVMSLISTIAWCALPDIDWNLIKIVPNVAVPWKFRLYGIFREPAMFCIYLGLGLAECLFIQTEKNYLKIMTYFVATLLTGSTTGYISVVFLIACFMMFEEHSIKWKIIFSIAVLFVGVVAINNGLVEYFVSKIVTTGANAASSNSRYYSIICGALVGMKYPIFGAGAIKSEQAFNNVLSYFSKEYFCWANMVTYLWASFGCLYIYFFLRGIGSALPNKKKIVSFCWLTFIMLLLCGETMTYSSVMYIFMLYGFKRVPFGKVKIELTGIRRGI